MVSYMRILGCLLLVTLVVVGCTVRLANSARPWQAQIVDAETKQPLKGVVVLAVWWKEGPSDHHPQQTLFRF